MFRSPDALFKAQSIAIVGASDRAKWPLTIYQNLTEHGWPGRVYPINPRREEVWGIPCYPDFAALPEAPDLGLFIIPAEAVPVAMEDAIKRGLKAAMVYAANIGEGTDPEIVARGERLKAMCLEAGVTLGGPNCMGGLVWPAIADGLDLETVPLYFELDGTFPNHPADPLDPANLRDMSARVIAEGAVLGLAFDGDADRVFAVDAAGRPVDSSLVGALVATRVLERDRGATVLHNLIC